MASLEQEGWLAGGVESGGRTETGAPGDQFRKTWKYAVRLSSGEGHRGQGGRKVCARRGWRCVQGRSPEIFGAARVLPQLHSSSTLLMSRRGVTAVQVGARRFGRGDEVELAT